MTEALCIAAMVIMYCLGFMLGGVLYARTPFWEGVRSVFRFGR